MKREVRLIKAFGKNKFGLVDLPKKVSGIKVSRILIGEESGCSGCFPHGYETINCRFYKIQRNWKRQRQTQWKNI
ncbi:hypothetical protein [Gynuella sp.]|uniref:hypothetical protein n=1 Tax=Gynuella sp. TaxID=2969146 RepID=UPI003D141837